jgi:sterol desaturase/sphingolipid hydroxylase (fatty acid hydroxylase superfamily)
LARHHYLHHRYPNKNFNVVFPLADYVLGTNARANEADLAGMRAEGLL